MKVPFARASALVGVVGVAIAGLMFGGGTAAAFPVTIPLSPTVGSVATGGGSVFTDPSVVPTTITISLAGAHPLSTFLVSACSVSFGCVNNPATDEIATDITGAFNGTVITPTPATFDFVNVVDIANPADAYQATLSSFAQTTVCNPFFPFLTGCSSSVVLPPGATVSPNGIVLVPPGTPVLTTSPLLVPVGSNRISAGGVCPAGYVGWITVYIGGTFQTVFCTGA